jgi:hypothetical protein
MATLTAAAAAATAAVPSKPIPAGMPGIAVGYYNLASAPTAADVINMCKLPAGATPTLPKLSTST